jgi:uncharacterized damage-inducible protein DinB
MRPSLTIALAVAVTLPAGAVAQAGPAVGSVKPLFSQVSTWIIQAAEQVPEDMYSFKPTPEVRSFGQLFGHVANAQYMFCATALGEKSPATQDAEKLTAKADIVAALKGSAAYCQKAYDMSDTKAMEPAAMFGMKGTRLWVLIFNATHDNEHYGNLVTYLRLKGMTPPSSQGG